MKIVVDYHLANARESGMARFIREMLAHLQKEDPSLELVLVDYDDMRALKTKPAKIFAVLKELLYTQFIIPLRALKYKWDHLYFPNPPSPFLPLKGVVLNIPDLSFWVQEKPFLPLRLYQWCVYAASAKAARHITTFSENSARDISRVLKVPREKITVIPLGVNDRFFTVQNSQNIAKVKSKYGITRPYILSVLGSFVPRKNANDLIDAYAALSSVAKQSVQLVFVGQKTDRYFTMITEYLRRQPVNDDIVFTGIVTEEELLNLYAGARLFVFPSKYEGFGLPPLEAMAAGIPAIVYNNSSLPEIVGNAGILVTDKMELRDAMNKLLIEQNICDQLVRAGKDRALLFTWEKAAQSLLEVLLERR
jgi:glycosyltransferase involved in cell wall biosynthesis